MNVCDAMTTTVLTITPMRTLHDAARIMGDRNVGAVVVLDPEQPGPCIITERDITRAVGAGGDPHRELVQDHLTADVIYAGSDWPLEEAARTMTAGGFRHLVVLDGAELEGIISMRDIVRAWSARAGERPVTHAAVGS